MNTVPIYNWVWQQGADLVMSLIYSEGPTDEETPVDLSDYQLRMDIFNGTTRIYTFNSDDISGDAEIDNAGDADNEAVLGADGTINITVPRSLTLPAGAVYEFTNPVSGASVTTFNYDMFLRNSAGKQQKILKGTITVEPSYTLWQ